MKQEDPTIARAHALAVLASQTEGIHSSLVCFTAAWLLREAGHQVKVCSQVLFHTDHQPRTTESIANLVTMQVYGKLVDELGVYEDVGYLALDRKSRWGLQSARVDEFPYVYGEDVEELNEIYANWGVPPSESIAMLELLRSQDCALLMQDETPQSNARPSQNRL